MATEWSRVLWILYSNFACGIVSVYQFVSLYMILGVLVDAEVFSFHTCSNPFASIFVLLCAEYMVVKLENII